MLEQFDASTPRAQKEYRTFVSAGRGASVWENLRGQMFLGSDTFIEEHAPVVACVAEIPRAQRLAGRPALSDVVSGADDAAAIAQAYAAHGYTMAEIAVHLGVHYSTISRRVRAWEAAQGEDMRGCKT